MLNCVDSFYKNFKFQISSFANPIKTFPIVNLTTGNFDIAAASFWTDYGEFVCCIVILLIDCFYLQFAL